MYCAPPNILSNQTYQGSILGLNDALLILEGIRQDVLPQVKRRLNDSERKLISPGSIYAWNETKLGMKRWTDGKNWSASKVKGPFLIYHEHDTDRNIKPNGLVKQSFSLTTKQSEKLHLIAYYSLEDRMNGILRGEVPSQDPILRKFRLDPSVYRSDFLNSGSREITVLPPHLGNPKVPNNCLYAKNAAMAGFVYPNNTAYLRKSHLVVSSPATIQQASKGGACQMPCIDTHFRHHPQYHHHVSTDITANYHKHQDRYFHPRDLPSIQSRVPQVGQAVPSNSVSDPHTNTRTLPSLSESIGWLEPIGAKVFRCSKIPDNEVFKLRSLDKTFLV